MILLGVLPYSVNSNDGKMMDWPQKQGDGLSSPCFWGQSIAIAIAITSLKLKHAQILASFERAMAGCMSVARERSFVVLRVLPGGGDFVVGDVRQAARRSFASLRMTGWVNGALRTTVGMIPFVVGDVRQAARRSFATLRMTGWVNRALRMTVGMIPFVAVDEHQGHKDPSLCSG